MKRFSILLFCLIIFSSFAYSQEQYGHIRGKVVDLENEPLPGLTITLESPLYGIRSMISSSRGTFRFINLGIGTYSLKCELSGFKTYIQERIIIRVGDNFDLSIILEPATLEENVTVVAKTPIVDTKKTGTAFNVTQEMLQEIPSARDPWSVLKQVPGVLVARENVGGSESGFQSSFVVKGANTGFNMYNMDGIQITDNVALGSSPRYYDYDSFEEMQIVTSGQDASIQNPGVSINFVTRRGTNKFQVVGRAFFTNDKLQADNRTQELIDLDYVGNRIEQVLDYGIQVGGSLVRDRLWFWFGYGAQDIQRLAINGFPEKAKLRGINIKLNFSLSQKNKVELAFIRYLKTADGREAGPFRPPETTTNLGGNGSPFFKFEDMHFFSDNFLLTLKLAYSWGKWHVEPKGGLDVQHGYDWVTHMWSGSYESFGGTRPSFNMLIDGNYFVEDVLGGDHEFKFGLEYRDTPVRSYSIFPGDARKIYLNGKPHRGVVYREAVENYGSDRYSAYLSDIYTRGRLTLILGLRLDREKGLNHEASVRASRVAPDLLPALSVPEADPGLRWLILSPRFGITYDLTGDGKTLLRGNLARYHPHMPAWLVTHVALSDLSYAGYEWNDLNRDDTITNDELIGYPTEGIKFFYGFDPWNPTRLDSPNGIDENLKPLVHDELILGIDREIFTDFSLGLSLTFSQTYRLSQQPFYDKETGAKLTQEDYIGPIQKSLFHGGVTYDYEYWTLNQFRYAGTYKESGYKGARYNYWGIQLATSKRLSNRWMMSASFTYQNFTQHYGEKGYLDPTNIDMLEGSDVTFLGANWIAKLSFLYQLPLGFNLSCFAHARQGYSNVQYLRVETKERAAVGIGGELEIYTEKPGDTRLEDFYNVDLSLVKDFRLGRYGQISLQVDVFNIFNSAHTLGRVGQINSPIYNQITSILNPRVIRFGIRYRF